MAAKRTEDIACAQRGLSLGTCLVVAATWMMGAEVRSADIFTDPEGATVVPLESSNLWPNGLGYGLQKGTREVGASVGVGLDPSLFRGSDRNELGFARLHYGRVLSDVPDMARWLRVQWEGRVEFLAGGQYDPEGAYLCAVTPCLRCCFMAGSRWVPFMDGGGGVSLTDIGLPDLGSRFQFNLQLGAGVNYVLREDLVATLQGRFVHLSNGGIESPNRGVNSTMISVGLAWLF